jgi:hypothetical protein
MNKVQIHFTSVFRYNCDIDTKDSINLIKDKDVYEDANIAFNVVNSKDTTVVTFEAVGYFSDCASAAREFMTNLLQSISTDDSFAYIITHDFLYPFVKIITSEIQYQSFHKTVRDGAYAYAGLEIEAIDDMRLNEAMRVLEINDHNGNYFRRCPNCKEFEIPDCAKLGKHIKRCPCCGLKLIKWG